MQDPRVYKALGLLLTYPTEALRGALGALAQVLDTAELAEGTRADLARLLSELEEWSLLDLQERYVGLFDRGRQLSLNLFEHVHGEAKERGQAMVDLQTMYMQNGVDPTGEQLPDYLPMMCEFLSLLPPDGARTMLGDLAVILRLLEQRLRERGSVYAAVPDALLELSRAPVDDAAVAAARGAETPEPPDDFDALDRTWKESEVTFGAGDAQASCSSGESSERLVTLRRTRN